MHKRTILGVFPLQFSSSNRLLVVWRMGVLIGALLSLSGTAWSQSSPIAWVVNSLGETLSEVNLVSGQVVTNSVTLGSMPNDVLVRGDVGYVVNSGSNQVQIIDLAVPQTTGAIEIFLGLNPYYIALDNQDRAFVTNLMTGNVSVLDLLTRMETDTLQIGSLPSGVCATPDFLFVTDIVAFGSSEPGQLRAFSMQTLEWVGNVVVGVNPQVVELGPDGNLHVVCTGNYADISGQVDIVDPQTLTVYHSIPIGGSPGSLAFSAENIAYLGSSNWSGEGAVLAYDAFTYQVLHGEENPIVVPSSAMGVAVTPTDHLLVCCFGTDQLVELDAEGNQTRTFLVGDGPLAVAIQESGPAVEPSPELKKTYSLTYNYPEPFNAATTVIFTLEVAAPVTFEVYNLSGQQVECRSIGLRSPGENQVAFIPRAGWNSGIYYYRLRAGESGIGGSMLYLK